MVFLFPSTEYHFTSRTESSAVLLRKTVISSVNYSARWYQTSFSRILHVAVSERLPFRLQKSDDLFIRSGNQDCYDLCLLRRRLVSLLVPPFCATISFICQLCRHLAPSFCAAILRHHLATLLHRHLAPPFLFLTTCAAISRRHIVPPYCASILLPSFLYCYIMSPYCVTTETLQILLQCGNSYVKSFSQEAITL